MHLFFHDTECCNNVYFVTNSSMFAPDNAFIARQWSFPTISESPSSSSRPMYSIQKPNFIKIRLVLNLVFLHNLFHFWRLYKEGIKLRTNEIKWIKPYSYLVSLHQTPLMLSHTIVADVWDSVQPNESKEMDVSVHQK